MVNGIYLSGTTDDGSPVFQMVFDTRIKFAAPYQSKEILERVQLEKYRLHYARKFKTLPFDDVKRGNDPPDFIVDGVQGELRLDCAALALENRRLAEALFNRLVERLFNQGNATWKNLAGCHVFVLFVPPDQLPPKNYDTSLDDEIETALASVVVEPTPLSQLADQVMRDGFPQQMPREIKKLTVKHDRFILSANFAPNWFPTDELSGRLGFQLHLQFSQTLHDISGEINRLVQQHDNVETQQLLLSVGGPDLHGYCYPAENMLGAFLKGNPISYVEAQHLQRVTVDIWMTGDIIEIPVARPT